MVNLQKFGEQVYNSWTSYNSWIHRKPMVVVNHNLFLTSLKSRGLMCTSKGCHWLERKSLKIGKIITIKSKSLAHYINYVILHIFSDFMWSLYLSNGGKVERQVSYYIFICSTYSMIQFLMIIFTHCLCIQWWKLTQKIKYGHWGKGSTNAELSTFYNCIFLEK